MSPESQYLITLFLLALIFISTMVVLIVALKTQQLVSHTLRQIEDLHTWVGKEDENGVKLVYFSRSMADTLKDLGDNIHLQSEAIKEQTEASNRLHSFLSGVKFGGEKIS